MSYPWIKEANKIFMGVLPAQFVIGLIIAFYTGTWIEAIAFGLPIIALPLFMIKAYPDAQITRVTVGIAVQLITALHIQQSFGLTEIHFEIFTVLAFLVFYRDWLVVAASTAVVAVHHILFFILQSNDVAVFVFEEGHISFGILVIHALFALAEGGVLMYVARKNEAAALSSLSLSNTVHEILKDPQKLNLAVELDEGNPEIEEFNNFVLAIRQLIDKTRTVGATVNNVAMHVAELSQDLQTSLSQTTMQVDSIASSSEEMSTTIAHVSSNANNVNDVASQTKSLSATAKETIVNSNEDVTQLHHDLTDTSDTINSLSEKCDRISQVMEAIKVVSEQTNLLALNAAIESARAGEHGRGFAVVADEVRSLSIKTRESVEEISEVSQALINDGKTSVTQMQNCLQSVEKAMTATSGACEMIDDVLNAITQVENNISEVAASADEQSATSSSIASSAQLLYDLSQKETASATESLNEVEILREHSAELEAQLAKFHV